MKYSLLTLMFTLASFSTQAIDLNGQELPDAIPETEHQPALKLVDSAVKDYYYLSNAYIGAIYQSDTSARPARMEFIVTSPRLSGRAMGVSLYESMALQLEWEEFEALESRMSTLVKMLDTKMERGDRIVISYNDESGSEIYVKNEYKGAIQGTDLFDVAAGVWLEHQTVGKASIAIADTTAQDAYTL